MELKAVRRVADAWRGAENGQGHRHNHLLFDTYNLIDGSMQSYTATAISVISQKSVGMVQ